LKQALSVASDFSTVGNISTISFNGRRGHFTIQITSFIIMPFDFVVLIPRPGLSELRVGHPTISKTEIIYELFTDDDSYAII
jgi:hypothetical protein